MAPSEQTLTLHPLFGITAIIGMLISSMSLNKTEGTPYHSHLKWQITTFWLGLVAYAVTFWVWQSFGYFWPIVIAFVFVVYRVLININRWTHQQAITQPF